MQEIISKLERDAKMQDVIKTLDRNAKEVQYGSVCVELCIHNGKIVKTVYKTSETSVMYCKEEKKECVKG